MKNLLLISALLISTVIFGQISRINPHAFDISDQTTESNVDMILSNDTTIDVNFYHLNVEIALDSAYIKGSVNYLVTSQIDGLTSLKLDLDSAFVVDSVSFPASTYSFADNVLTINFLETYNIGDAFSFSIYYKGVPILAGGYKGLRYENHDGNELIIASLSTPYLAHTWWPCKDGTEDKSDSTFIDIMIKDTTISSIPVIALSNGLLDTVITIGDKKKFCWKHRYPVVPYYVMVAISNYKHFQQIYNGTDYSFPIDYYVFESHLEAAQEGVLMIPEAIEFFTNTFGPYPFLQEKYAMTQLGYYGAIENQTNTITNNMSIDWFYTSVHELAHQWFADMITCQTWNHGWLNEGFASYAEALFNEFKFNGYHLYMEYFGYYDAGTVYLEDVSDPYNVFQPIIYDKGAYVLHMLRGVLGDSTFFDAIYAYANNESFKYKQATTEDFQLICENVSGEDLDYFFNQWIYDERFPIYYYNYEYNQFTGDLDVVIEQKQGVIGWREVFVMPMEIGVEFVDGTDTIIDVLVDNGSENFTFALNKDVLYAEIDPNNWILKNAVWDPSITVGLNEVKQELFEVFPNPNSGTFSVSLSNGLAKPNFRLYVVDVNGKVYYNSLFKKNQEQTLEVKINNLTPGIYFLKLYGDNINYYRKIVVIN